MKVLAIALIAFLIVACRSEKTEVTTETSRSETSATTLDTAAIDTAAAAQKTETALERAGEVTESAAREAAQKTGTALEKAGKKIQEHAKPGDQ